MEIELGGRGEVREGEEERCLPDWTDHWPCRGAAVGGALETAFRMSLGSERTFAVALSGGGGGADMIVC